MRGRAAPDPCRAGPCASFDDDPGHWAVGRQPEAWAASAARFVGWVARPGVSQPSNNRKALAIEMVWKFEGDRRRKPLVGLHPQRNKRRTAG